MISKDVAALFLLTGAGLYGQGSCSSPVQLAPAAVTRNSPFRVTINPAPKVTQGNITFARQDRTPRVESIALDGNTASYTIPPDFPLGSFSVSLTMGGNSYPACDRLTVTP